MKNTDNYNLINAITMNLDTFKELVEEITDGLATVDYEFGACITSTDKATETDEYWNESITDTLSKYFGVTVTSWHSDVCEYPMIFICYK